MNSVVHSTAPSSMTIISRSGTESWSSEEFYALQDSNLNTFAIAQSKSGKVIYLPGEILHDQIAALVQHGDFTLEVQPAGRPLLMS